MKKLLNKYNNNNSFELGAKMYLIFLLLFFSRVSNHYLFIVLAFIIFYAIIDQNFLTKSIFWGLVSCMIIPALVTKYNFTGNHTFVAFYMAVLFLIASFYKKFTSKILEINARNLLCIMMLFAIAQKFLSKSFMNASSVSFLNLTGGFFTHFHRFFP